LNVPNEKSRRWIKGLHEGIDQLGEDIKLNVMRSAAIHCAEDLLLLCKDYLGKPINSEKDLISGWIMLKNDRGLTSNWVLEDNIIRATFNECGCPLVRSGLVELHPVQCYCSQNMIENVFSQASKKTVNVKIERSIGRGDSVCEFIISFEGSGS